MKRVIFFLISFLFIISNFQAKQPYVILVSFDAFRWDYSLRDITPNLQKMMDDGVHALSLRPSYPSKTFPNHYSIISGMYPANHGIIANNFKDMHSDEWYRMGNNPSAYDAKWYLGEAFWETAERNGITTASFYWPGSEMNLKYRQPTYVKHYDYNKPYRERIDTLITWLQLPPEKRPHFLNVYFRDTDEFGHKYGPNSPEVNTSIKRCDSLIGYLYNGLSKIGMQDSVNVIVLSDHGMTEISKQKTVDIQDMLKGFTYFAEEDGPFMFIEPDKNDSSKIEDTLKKKRNHYQVFTKNNIPSSYHFSNNPNIPTFILMAEKGWSLEDSSGIKHWGDYKNATHGYDNNLLDMHGTFIAKGPAFKKGYETGTLWNVDIYPLLCKIFNISPRSNIDGKLERIEFILKGK